MDNKGQLTTVGSELPPSNELLPDAESKKEAKAFGDDKRAEESKQTIHTIFLWFLRIAAFTFIILFVIRMLHYMFPDTWCWLSETRLQGIDKSLFSGALGGLVVNYIKQVFPFRNK